MIMLDPQCQMMLIKLTSYNSIVTKQIARPAHDRVSGPKKVYCLGNKFINLPLQENPPFDSKFQS